MNPPLPARAQQIVQVHSGLIVAVVHGCRDPAGRAELDPLLRQAVEQGWARLVDAIRLILDGRRDDGVCAGLDDEDRVIAEAILRGLADPSTLPDPQAKPDASLAAPGLAEMIHAAAHGDVAALELLGNMAEQMSRVGGDMARLGAAFRPMVNGERDADRLARGMGAQGQGLVAAILADLGRLGSH